MRGLPCDESAFSSLRIFIANSLSWYVLFRSCHQEVHDVFLLDVFVVLIGRKRQPSCRDGSISIGFVRLLALCAFHALGAPLSPGNADTASHVWSGPQLCFWRRLQSTLCFLFSGSSKAPGRRLRCSPRLPPHQSCIDQHQVEVHHRWRRREEIFVSVLSSLGPTRRQRGLPLSLVVLS